MAYSIGFIGFGQLAKKLWMGFSPFLNQQHINTYYTNQSQTDLSIEGLTFLPLDELIKQSNILIIAIKPQQLPTLLQQLQGINCNHCSIVSLLAGVNLTTLQQAFTGCHYIFRVMPNVNAEYQQSMTVVSMKTGIPESIQSFVTKLFKQVGSFQPIKESQMDACTAMFGSGPAFFYKLIQDCEHYLASTNINTDQARRMLTQLLAGITKTLQQRPDAPFDLLLKEITSPNGTTQAGLSHYDQACIGKHWQSMLTVAQKRSEELSNEIKLD